MLEEGSKGWKRVCVCVCVPLHSGHPGGSRAEDRAVGTSRGPSSRRHASPSPRVPAAPSTVQPAAWGLVGLRVLRPRRPPATARVRTTIPKEPCAPARSWEVWSRAGRACGRRAGVGTTCPRTPRGGRGGRGFERRVSRPRQGCVGCGGCGRRRRRPGPASVPGGRGWRGGRWGRCP